MGFKDVVMGHTSVLVGAQCRAESLCLLWSPVPDGGGGMRRTMSLDLGQPASELWGLALGWLGEACRGQWGVADLT